MRIRLFKIAAITLKRASLAAAVLLGIGLYLLCSALSDYALVRDEKARPCELSVTGDTAINFAALLRAEGVTAVTPVLRVNGTLTVGVNSVDLLIEGLNGDYMEFPIVVGSMFPEGAVMPQFLLNNAARDALADGEGSDQTLSGSNDTARLGEKKYISSISGVVDDGLTEPRAYMDYDTLKTILSTQAYGGSSYEARVRLAGAGAESTVLEELRKLGCRATGINEERYAEWELTEQSAFQKLLSSGALILCAVILFLQNIKVELLRHGAEYVSLTMMGLSGPEARRIPGYRALLLLLASGAVACIPTVMSHGWSALTLLVILAVLAAVYIVLSVSCKHLWQQITLKKLYISA